MCEFSININKNRVFFRSNIKVLIEFLGEGVIEFKVYRRLNPQYRAIQGKRLKILLLAFLEKIVKL
ncbi:MAG TPA: hypothetical protein ENG40_04040 [Thermoprotei archaeon]|nr:hypothetical protein [Thermoprotei archaeon]